MNHAWSNGRRHGTIALKTRIDGEMANPGRILKTRHRDEKTQIASM